MLEEHPDRSPSDLLRCPARKGTSREPASIHCPTRSRHRPRWKAASSHRARAAGWDSEDRLVCTGATSACDDVTYRYDVDGTRLSTEDADGVRIRVRDLVDYDAATQEAAVHIHAFGRRIATKYIDPASLRAPNQTTTLGGLPLDPDTLLLALALTGAAGLLGAGVRAGVPGRVAQQPVRASLALGTAGAVALLLPVQAHAGGGGGGTSVVRRWLFHDHLGTNVLSLTQAGGVATRRLFEPFGQLLNDADTESTPRLFTGQPFEAGAGLYDFGARWYDAEAGRFTGVDPVVQDITGPQTLNGYGYVGNNPLANVDPDGRIYGSGFIAATLAVMFELFFDNFELFAGPKALADAIFGRGIFRNAFRSGIGLRNHFNNFDNTSLATPVPISAPAGKANSGQSNQGGTSGVDAGGESAGVTVGTGPGEVSEGGSALGEELVGPNNPTALESQIRGPILIFTKVVKFGDSLLVPQFVLGTGLSLVGAGAFITGSALTGGSFATGPGAALLAPAGLFISSIGGGITILGGSLAFDSINNTFGTELPTLKGLSR